jgi:hypothetical protein
MNIQHYGLVAGLLTLNCHIGVGIQLSADVVFMAYGWCIVDTCLSILVTSRVKKKAVSR